MSGKEKLDSGKKTDLGLLEEDDDFEEFPAEGSISHTSWRGLSHSTVK